MAFTTSNIRADIQGSTKIVYGNWAGTVGDGSGTYAVASGKVLSSEFSINDSTGPTDCQVPITTSLSGYLTTITVYYPRTVTAGTFKIEFA